MKVNRTRFSNIKLEFEILKMKAAYIAAEQEIIRMSENGMADGIKTVTSSDNIIFEGKEMDPETFIGMEMDDLGNARSLTVKDLKIRDLEDKLQQLEEVGRELLKEEKYELMQEALELWEKTKQQINNLKSL